MVARARTSRRSDGRTLALTLGGTLALAGALAIARPRAPKPPNPPSLAPVMVKTGDIVRVAYDPSDDDGARVSKTAIAAGMPASANVQAITILANTVVQDTLGGALVGVDYVKANGAIEKLFAAPEPLLYAVILHAPRILQVSRDGRTIYQA